MPVTVITLPDLGVGDYAVIDPRYPRWGGVYEVLKVNPTTYVLRDVLSGAQVRAGHGSVQRAPGHRVAQVRATLATRPAPPALSLGTLVRFTMARKAGERGLFVVIKKSADRVNVARLGGDNDRYWRTTPAALEVVDPATVTP